MAMKNIFLQLLLSYAIFTVVVYFLSDFAIFPVPKASYKDTAEIIKLKMASGEKISAIYLLNPKAKYTILFSHGNGEDLGYLMPFFKVYRDHGFSVFAYDYAGYGTSEGRATEQSTYSSIKAAYQYLTDTLKISPSNIILHGRSLGTGPTLDLATQYPVKGIILESPMLTAFRVMTGIPILPVDKFRNNAKIQKIAVPILFIHGTEDEVIPFWQGKKLFEMAKAPKYFFAVQGANHNNVAEIAGGKYWETLKAFAYSNNQSE